MERHFCLDDSAWFRMVELDEVDSTNSFLKRYHAPEPRKVTLVTAEFQTAGRGSASNTWESAAGKNLLFSILTHPRMVEAERMYVLSEVVALAVCDALNGFAPGFQIKWPNDIYYGDRKIVGMLIENDLEGKVISNCIMGVGINVNQTRFESDAPNPISLAQILGREVDRRLVLEKVVERFLFYYGWLEGHRNEKIHKEYLNQLYRLEEQHEFQDSTGRFLASIQDVEPTGHLLLLDAEGKMRRYAFKEVQFL
ncbi:MAG: biotin--[Bacteroidaceae bacterium]|nr:biotin--[acetyl-CoA-carboxylase] ligase [Bacteroidaceae bacterium]